MSYFNAEQEAHMADLAKIPADTKCWCGWFMKGECHSCPSHLSCANKLALRCGQCGNAPNPHALAAPIIHTVNCPTRSVSALEKKGSAP